MTGATHDEIVDLIGDVDDLLLERLVATGASIEEVAEAWADLEDEHRFQIGRAVSVSPRVAEARSILEEVLEERDDEDDGRAMRAHGVC